MGERRLRSQAMLPKEFVNQGHNHNFLHNYDTGNLKGPLPYSQFPPMAGKLMQNSLPQTLHDRGNVRAL